MNKILLIGILVGLLLGCNQKKQDSSDMDKQLESDSLSRVEGKVDFSNSQLYIDPETGDSIYVDFDVQYESEMLKEEEKQDYEQYFIVSSYSSYKKDEILDKEMARWQELESASYLERVVIGQAEKYYISLGKYNSKAEVIQAFRELRDKYPKENINFQSISQ